MLRFIIRRFLNVIPTTLIIIAMIFFMIRAVPGGPFSKERKVPEAIQKNIDEKYHLNDPLWKQFIDYLADIVLRFDFGPSFTYRGYTVNDLIKKQFPVSMTYGGLALLIAVIFGIFFGVISALKQNKFWDYLFMSFALIGISAPVFVIATLLILLLARTFQIVPVGGWGTIPQLLIPVMTMSFGPTATITRLTKTGLLDNIRKDFVMTARAKGLPENLILYRHVLKGSLIPVITVLGPLFAFIITGGPVVEQICGIPGMGRMFIQSALNRDYLLFGGAMIVFIVLLIAMNFVIDIMYAFLDPRIKYS